MPKKLVNLTGAMKKIKIGAPPNVELNDILDPKLLSKWPARKDRVPVILLHKTIDFAQHAEILVARGTHFYQPYLGPNYTKIICFSCDDHKAMVEYFVEHSLPFHTFGYPNDKILRVVIRGLPTNTDLNKFKEDLKSVGIPIKEINKMRCKNLSDETAILVLASVPYNDEGKKLLRLKKAYGKELVLEPPRRRTKQCYRCQKWGHAQRFCHGVIRCLKCAGNHFSVECTRDPDKEPPTCANCGGNHVASFRQCFYCPDATSYKANRQKKLKKLRQLPPQKNDKRKLVTPRNLDKLYKPVRAMPNPKKTKIEPVPIPVSEN